MDCMYNIWFKLLLKNFNADSVTKQTIYIDLREVRALPSGVSCIVINDFLHKIGICIYSMRQLGIEFEYEYIFPLIFLSHSNMNIKIVEYSLNITEYILYKLCKKNMYNYNLPKCVTNKALMSENCLI